MPHKSLRLWLAGASRRDLHAILGSRRALGAVGVVGLAGVIGLGSITALSSLNAIPISIEARFPLSVTPNPEIASAPTSAPTVVAPPTQGATPVPTATQPWPTPGSDGGIDPVLPHPSITPDASASPTATPVISPFGGGAQITDASALKVVVVVGPSADTANDLIRGEDFAQRAESYGMNVTRIYYPHATWHNVVASAQGANLLAYFGHGNGWPSPYPPFQEQTKDGFGLDTSDGAAITDVTYYGGDQIRRNIKLAPNSVVVLSHLCYSAGNGEPGMVIPTWDIAWQRVDNTAAAFLYAGARVAFAIATGSATAVLDGLMKSNKTMDQIFMTRGARAQPYYGFTGWDDQYLDSTRMPGNQMHLDPGQTEGFLRAVTGDLSFTAKDWRSGT